MWVGAVGRAAPEDGVSCRWVRWCAVVSRVLVEHTLLCGGMTHGGLASLAGWLASVSCYRASICRELHDEGHGDEQYVHVEAYVVV